MKTKLLTGLMLLSGGIICAPSAFAQIDLTGQGFVTYGDAQSYSLPIATFNGCTTCNIQAGPGQIDLFTKLGLGSNGSLNNGVVGMDNAFDTPQANTIDGFRMTAANEPTNTFAGDRIGWWDATLAALSSQLNLLKNSMVFFFANNETGGGDNLAAYAKIQVTKISTNTLLGTFEMTNDFNNDGSSVYANFLSGGGGIPFGNVANYTSTNDTPNFADFLESGGEICLGPNQTAPCFQHNLGGDHAAYAVVFPELDALIAALALGGADLSDYAIHVDYRLGCGPELPGFPTVDQGGNTVCDPNYALNGGDEKVFLGTQLLPSVVPEPSSLLLVGLALFGLGYARRRKNII